MKNPLAIGLLVVATVAVQAFGQTALNPTVKVLPRPQSPVPAECADGVTSTQPPQPGNGVPEPEPELQPQPVSAPSSVPPSNELRALLRRAQIAAAGEDYAAFKAAVADVRRAVASYPAGGERSAANDLLRVYTDVARVWDYAMASTTGSFFDNTAQGGSLLNALKRYPNYGRALAEETVTVGGKTLYPTRETRRFLVQESARHLARLGVSVSPRESAMKQTERARHAEGPPVTQAAAASPKKQTRPKPERKTAEAAPKAHTAKHPSARTAKASSPKAATPRIESTPVPKPKQDEHAATKIARTSTVAPAKPPAASTSTGRSPLPVPTTAIVTPPIAATSLPPATTSVTPSPTTSGRPSSAMTTGTTTAIATTASTETTDTAVPDTATTSTAVPAEKQNGNMNLILAIVLILVGIGLLVVLLRAKD